MSPNVYEDKIFETLNIRNDPLEPDNKIPKLGNERREAKSSKQHVTVKLIKKYKHLMYLNWLSQNEMIAVEVKPLSLTEQLPPCLKQNLFGTK
ncbi:uncharacterized protein LOC108737449 [Agrilus planipennis]|uniref:Uncharacterized protein LOC108737449 n=1 Tax=Agrilus planipennis TaxID=224129 RepID=A0A7F5RIM4_AGRPL|nr:uncharacterized protein LOC108737449 [Agrilus planipennis]